MSSNKTANYNLHLWQPGDDFLRTEFNENNEVIDAALAEVASATRVKLFEITVGQECTEIEVDVSSIDWSQWDHIEIRDRLTSDSSAEASAGSYIRVNGDAGGNYFCTNANGYVNRGTTYMASVTDHSNPGVFSAQCTLRVQVRDGYCLASAESQMYGKDGSEYEGYVSACRGGYHLNGAALSTLHWCSQQSYWKYQPGGKLIFWGVK